jgi:hypothetical protein
VGRFQAPHELGLTHNEGLVEDPAGFAREHGAASWLYLCGEEFASMDGGMSYDEVRAAVPESANVVSDPPVELTTDLAREQLAALERLPRPTLVTCRTGPRSAALLYLYAGLQAEASPDEVLTQAEAAGEAFAKSDEIRAWLTQGLEELG